MPPTASHVLFGEKRMLQAVGMHATEKAALQLKSMAAQVKSHIHGYDPSDDLTILVLRYTNPEPSAGVERHLVLHNDLKEIPRLAEFVKVLASDVKMAPTLALNLNLALEEVVSNVMLYAYPPGSSGLVEVEAIVRDGNMDFIVTDAGIPFDPTSVGRPDLTLGVNERPVGGLGIYLVRTIMDQVSYARVDGKNVLSMTKKL